jgi:hypothetical protein
MEWPPQENEPTKHWLSAGPADAALSELVYFAKHRWIIERDYQELKQDQGLGQLKDGAGAAFIITPAYASSPTASWFPNGAGFPLCPQRLSAAPLR